jgi:hypothetical protein
MCRWEAVIENKNFKQTIDDIFKNKNIIPFSQITEMPAFPKTYVLVTLAFKAYKDNKERETDVQYETRLALNSENFISHFKNIPFELCLNPAIGQ